ncbi:Voa1p ASCRUDRAFT_129116 [Ascoidea rubescens DSM 1968]|uniref:Protein BIG1 n=1 Tax=Ascoidea rubescens DSM 1968 TaxID=1344418 RepID=A0A1D2V8U1_9ASCO|nr:hypothetical protein ASCRUDRAFT_129116 [Ascoidea rubescens DSM 1968]ODV58019.1 hypothetical protein ASCRUDRAFT_129116 [Ascoidea rubescens DSM 1968]
MRSLNVLVSVLGLFVCSVSAFVDTSPFLLKLSNFDEAKNDEIVSSLPQYIEYSALESQLNSILNEEAICNYLLNSDSKLIIAKFPNLKISDINSQSFPFLNRFFKARSLGDYSKNSLVLISNYVRYTKNDVVDLNYKYMGCKCASHLFSNEVNSVEKVAHDSLVYVIEMDSISDEPVEKLSKLLNVDNLGIIVQGVPDLSGQKRGWDDEVYQEDSELLSEEIEEYLGSDENNDKPKQTSSSINSTKLLHNDIYNMAMASGNNSTINNGNLFQKYQFFSTGIFMGLIVGFLILLVLLQALSWISSIEVSYKALDKPVVTPGKKTD